ncbi:MAG TPA: type II toxin-antitoxin system RelE/ParE family toxin [Burkholderiaceae bacterium]|jgi:plasmid stabilization system protein ParE|nr:type II toxin-antitoxin system RelE/ParE family toxin [Burkholderiaceae bacterium]
MRHEFRPQAQQELLDATRWYLANAGPGVAAQFERAVQRALRLLAFMPQVGRPGYPGVRTWHLKDFPYTLVYRVTGDAIVILAVAHQSREPGYWAGR